MEGSIKYSSKLAFISRRAWWSIGWTFKKNRICVKLEFEKVSTNPSLGIELLYVKSLDDDQLTLFVHSYFFLGGYWITVSWPFLYIYHLGVALRSIDKYFYNLCILISMEIGKGSVDLSPWSYFFINWNIYKDHLIYLHSHGFLI